MTGIRIVSLGGYIAAGFIAAIFFVAIAGLLQASPPSLMAIPWSYIINIILFSIIQATLSALLSLLLGTALALALTRRPQLQAYGFTLALLNMASVLPVIVVVLGIVTVYGRSGWLGSLSGYFGVGWGNGLYGLPGILIAHVFFNAPLATRTAWVALCAIPSEHWRLATHLGMKPGTIFRFIDWPALVREMPRVGVFIFFLCFTSFAAVLALGGGPQTATLEVAIYEAIRFEADFSRAGILALLQMLICGLVAWPLLRLSGKERETVPTGFRIDRPDTDCRTTRIADSIIILLAALLMLPPMAAIVLSGLSAWTIISGTDILEATLTSLSIALPAAILAILLSLALASAARHWRLVLDRYRLAEGFGYLAMAILVLPSFTIITGLFVVLRHLTDPFTLAMPMIIIINALMALPFTFRHIEPALMIAGKRFNHLAESLGITGWNRLRFVDWPLLHRPVIMAFTIAIALSSGDLGVAALFGDGNLVTLPLLIYQLMGAYRMEEAAAAALVVALIILGLFWGAQTAISSSRIEQIREK